MLKRLQLHLLEFVSHMRSELISSSPYDGKWSKTMVGYGPEDNHFVAELTYNYGIGEYRLGNDFLVCAKLSKALL